MGLDYEGLNKLAPRIVFTLTIDRIKQFAPHRPPCAGFFFARSLRALHKNGAADADNAR
jgi:hypothetical protein